MDLLEMLLAVVDVDAGIVSHDGTPLEMAVTQRNQPAVEALVRSGRNLNLNRRDEECGNTPLHTAVILGLPEIVRLLACAPGVDRRIRNRDGFTAFDLAELTGDDRMIAAFNPPVRMLVEREAGLHG